MSSPIPVFPHKAISIYNISGNTGKCEHNIPGLDSVLEKHFCCWFVLNYPLRDGRVVVGGQRPGRPWLGPGLVRVTCASLSLFI